MAKALGAKISEDKPWADKYPLRLTSTVANAERILRFPKTWREYYDQGREGACVGYSSSQMMTFLNRRRFDARWLWNEAKKIDPWPDTNPGDDNGTSVDAAMTILRDRGHCALKYGKITPENMTWGIAENRWASTVDELRSSIQNGIPVVMGTYWFSNFDEPYQKENGEWFCGKPGWDISTIRGGHAYMFNAVSDKRGAFRTPNSWGAGHPQVWFLYEAVEKLLRMNGEATLVTDRA